MPFVRFNAKMSGTKSMCPTYLATWLPHSDRDLSVLIQVIGKVTRTPVLMLVNAGFRCILSYPAFNIILQDRIFCFFFADKSGGQKSAAHPTWLLLYPHKNRYHTDS